ncbi:MAG: hypothetical protein K2M82_03715 [Lachnospiraceae bacterium]|nr:hypothetical protein [Lachnospiraceae bacterium]
MGKLDQNFTGFAHLQEKLESGFSNVGNQPKSVTKVLLCLDMKNLILKNKNRPIIHRTV